MSNPQLSTLLKEEQATQKYYDAHAQSYFDLTLRINMSAVYNRFLRYVPAHGRILDAGSGSGRDTLAFVERGYQVDAFDASAALCALSTRMTGVQARVLRFQEFESLPRYDAIWACASLLHVPKDELPDAIRRLIAALKPGGAMYVSFKHGAGERISEDGRFFIDLDEPALRQLFSAFSCLKLAEVWVSIGEGAHRGRDEWINAIALKTSKQGER
jgi:SAM-dependent methyltransferase